MPVESAMDVVAYYQCACGFQDALNGTKAWCADCRTLRVPYEVPVAALDAMGYEERQDDCAS